MGRELFIVARSHPERYRFFLETFADAPTVGVIWDRRFGERRHAIIPVAVDRRREERRRSDPDAELQRIGHAFIALDESRSPAVQ